MLALLFTVRLDDHSLLFSFSGGVLGHMDYLLFDHLLPNSILVEVQGGLLVPVLSEVCVPDYHGTCRSTKLFAPSLRSQSSVAIRLFEGDGTSTMAYDVRNKFLGSFQLKG